MLTADLYSLSPPIARLRMRDVPADVQTDVFHVSTREGKRSAWWKFYVSPSDHDGAGRPYVYESLVTRRANAEKEPADGSTSIRMGLHIAPVLVQRLKAVASPQQIEPLP